MPNNVNIPERARDWPREAKASAISEDYSKKQIREDIDALIGERDPAWKDSTAQPGQFTVNELAKVLLACGGGGKHA